MFDRFLYAPDSRYARPADGSERSIATLGREDVQRFYRARYLPGSVTLVFAGDVTTELAERLTMNSLGSWAGGAASPVAAADRPARLTRALHLVAKEDAPQSELRIGHVGLPRNHADYFPATVMNAVLGGLFSSRINLNLREAHAYTYGAFSGFEWRRAAGPWSVSTAVKSEITHDAARETLAEIDRIREAPIANDELTLATSYLDGVFPIRYETTTAIASALGNLVVYGLPDDYFDRYRANVRAVTVDDVLAAARRHIHPDALQLVVVGDPAVVLRPLETLGFGPVARYDAEGNAVEEGRRAGASV
jgi:zinc protease